MTDNLKKLHDAATPGPWKVGRLGMKGEIKAVLAYDPPIDGFPEEWHGAAYFCDSNGDGESVGIETDPEFIAAMRNATPAILALVEAVRDYQLCQVEEIDECVDAIDTALAAYDASIGNEEAK